MPRSLSTSLVVAAAATAVLSWKVHGFHQPVPTTTRTRTSSSSLLSMIATNNDPAAAAHPATGEDEYQDLFIQDGRGHINPELARRIYKWEEEQRQSLNLPRFQYSTRKGLRWVLEYVPNGDEDLIQEGVIALMQAMTEFESKAPDHLSFEEYCKQSIRQALKEYVLTSRKGQGSSSRASSILSVESTVQIDDPSEMTHRYSNQDEWELREGLVLDNGQGELQTEELVEEFLDETLQYEGEDQMWIHQQQVAAPLTHSIPDDEEEEEDDEIQFLNNGTAQQQQQQQPNLINPDDRFLADMIRFNVDELLGSTLDDVESQVIQMRFGLGEEPMTQKEVAFELNMTVGRVRKVQKMALEKLRTAYTEKYLSNSNNNDDMADEEGGQFYGEDSV